MTLKHSSIPPDVTGPPGTSHLRLSIRVTLDRVTPFLCARHGVDLGGGSPLRIVMTGTVSRTQLRHRKVGWGGSPRRNPERTNSNRIAGRRGGVTRQWTGTPDSHPDAHAGKSGRDGGKISVLPWETSAGLGATPEQDGGNAIRCPWRSQQRP